MYKCYVRAHTEGACENARIVKLIWVFTWYTSVTHLPMIIKYLLHAWPNKTNAILSRYANFPEHLTAPRLITLIACASNPSLNSYFFAFCVFFHAFVGVCWLFFKINFFSVDPDLGPNWLYRLSAVANLIARKIICRWRPRPNFKGQFMRVLYYRICEQRLPR